LPHSCPTNPHKDLSPGSHVRLRCSWGFHHQSHFLQRLSFLPNDFLPDPSSYFHLNFLLKGADLVELGGQLEANVHWEKTPGNYIVLLRSLFRGNRNRLCFHLKILLQCKMIILMKKEREFFVKK
jgi:hypothetical protein